MRVAGPTTYASSSNSSTAATAAPAASIPGQVYSNTTLPDSLGSYLIVSTFYPNFKIRSHGLHFMGVEATTLCLRDQITRAR